jgi:hypothetical protein
MPAFAYARSGNADVELAVQLASLIDAGCSDIAIDRTHGRHPRDLRRRAALLERLKPGDTVTVYRLDCLAVSRPDLVITIARIRSQNAILLTAAPYGPNSFCNDTIDAITSAFCLFGNPAPQKDDDAPRHVGRSAILTPGRSRRGPVYRCATSMRAVQRKVFPGGAGQMLHASERHEGDHARPEYRVLAVVHDAPLPSSQRMMARKALPCEARIFVQIAKSA